MFRRANDEEQACKALEKEGVCVREREKEKRDRCPGTKRSIRTLRTVLAGNSDRSVRFQGLCCCISSHYYVDEARPNNSIIESNAIFQPASTTNKIKPCND